LGELDAKKSTALTFYTNDIIGKFKIIIQGLTENDLIYAEKAVEVLP